MHSKRLIKQHDHYTGALCAGDNKRPLKCAVLSHNIMSQMSQVESAIGMLTAGITTRAVDREFHVHFSTISRLQHRFREFGNTSNLPDNRRPSVWHRVGERFADVFVVNRVPHGGSGVKA